MTLLEDASELAAVARSAGLRDMAEQALEAYGLNGAALRLLEEKKNVTWRVDAPGGERFLLRLCRPDGYTREEIASEAAWLLALRRQERLLVPEPVEAEDGSCVVRCQSDGLEPRSCILFRWVEGETLDASISPAMMERVGEVVARLHAFNGRFVPPPGFRRPRHDCGRMFGGSEVLPPGCGEELVSRSGRDLLNEAARRVRAEIEALGTGPEVFGMIHTDPEPDNMVTRDGEVFPIDFADCGWGYYLYDVAASLLPLGEKKDFPALREAFLRGYGRRPEHEALLDTFLIARGLFAVRWMLVHGWETPKVRAYAAQVVPHILGEVRRYLEGRGAAARLSTVQLLSQLRERGVQLAAEGDRLRLRAPKGALTPELQAELAERKAEVLAFLRRGAAVSEAPPIPRAPRVEGLGLPLSFSQGQLWFLDQFDPGNPAYNIPQSVHLEGEIRLDLLEKSLNEVVRRHEVLRTTFGSAEGQPVQIVAPSLALRMPVADLGGIPPAARETEVLRLSREEARRPFDLAAGPLLRLTALRLARAEHRILVTTHHIVSDGWSGGVFVRELATVYVALAQGRPSPLPELPIQFGDYACWQRGWLQGEVLERQLAYWREKLAGAPAVLDLPSDRPRTRYQTTRGGRQNVLLPPDLSERLRTLAQRSGATLFMTLLAGFDALVFRYSGREDVVIGSPIANRNRTETEALIGFFVNTLVLRTTFSGGEGFGELLGRVKQTTVEAFTHQDLTFEKLVEDLRPERSLTHTPLFQVVFNFQNAPLPALRLEGLTLTWVSAPTGTEKFDLNIAAREAPEGILLVLRYKRDLFDPPTIGRLAEHFRALLEAAEADPERPVDELPLLGEAERALLLREWNDTAAPVEEGAFHERFARQAARTPGAPAVAFGGQALSYVELDRRANRLAHRLRRLGAGRGSFVGICLERSVEMAIAIFGVLKAGAAYVPLDPEYPAERLAFLVRDAEVRVLVTQSRWLGILPSERVTAVRLDVDDVDAEAASSPGIAVGADDLAYVIYTSGTTGEPKGAMIRHGAMANYASALRAAIYGDRRVPLRVSLNARIAFDASVKQLSHLLWGDCLEIVPDAVRMDAEALVAFARERLDVLDCSPSQLKLLLKSGLPVDGTRPSIVLIGGEAIEESTWRELGACAGTRFYNHYGPTECTVNTTICRISGDRPRLGRPVANMSIHLLDPGQRPVPVGVPGEVCIGGAGLGRGYLGRPRQTAEKFIPDPFGGEPGARLYRSGDLARLLPTGEVEFLGRIDHQVKLRGFRIELGEIEAALRSHSTVREAVVLLRDDSEDSQAPGERRLVAYVIPRLEEELPAVPELRAFLRSKLPDYMMPAAFVILERLPLTPNGKLDRRALPAPGGARAGSIDVGEAPRTPTEERVAGIWAEVLGLDRVGRDDNFFEIGGHSLLATQVVSRVRQSFGIDLALRRLFESPTLAAFAEAVDGSGGEQELPPLVPASRDGDLPLSFAQQRLWFLDRFSPGSAAYNVPGALRLSGPLRADLLERVLHELERRHETLRTTFPNVEGEPRQMIAAGPRLTLPVVDLEGLPDAFREPEARRLARAEARRPFDLERGPLVRACLLRLAGRDHIALLAMHHIVSDAWSMVVFLRELAALYGAFLEDRPSPLPELPVQYADFACWQRGWLAGEVLETQLGYWRRQLAGAPEGLDLPTDRPRPAVQTSRGGQRRLALAPGLGQALAELGRREEATPFMTLLAGFAALLARLSGQDDLVIGSPIAGRNHREIEGIIGFFVNTLVLRVDVSGAPGFRELVGRVRHTALDAYAHQDLPFERLVEELAPERSLGRTPLFQVMFALHNASRETLELPGLVLTPLGSESGTAKFDLSLVLQEEPDGSILGGFEYNADLFDGSFVERMGAWLERLLAAAVERSEAPVPHLPMLSGEELRQVLADCNETAMERPRETRFLSLFERQAAQRPDAPAVKDGMESLTYGELDRRAMELARGLDRLGVGPESVVALVARRSVDLVVAMLAVDKAGGAYLPLDPAWPEARLRDILLRSGVRLVLAEDGIRSRLEETGLRIEPVSGAGWRQPGGLASRRVHPGNLAYVIYTSGSTGVPKGVLISHAALLNMVLWQIRAHGITAADRTTWIASPAFDATFFELWAYLATGAAVVVIEDQARLSPAGLLERWAAERITIALLPTPLAEAALEHELPSGLALRALLVGGDRWRRAPEGPIPFGMWNHYGPTESTVLATWAAVEPGEQGPPRIGRPVDNTRVYVVDPALEPVPAGVPGELVIDGAGLARGYLGRPDLTAATFIPDPFGEPGGRLYRTGDLVRRRSAGDLEFLGRIDHQVKIRGFRIELGEIEATLGSHPRVREAVALALGEDRLVLAAYVVLSGAVSMLELKEHLRARLPEPMVPTLFVPLERMPLTSNDKVDRRALAHLAPERDEETSTGPLGPTEEILAGIWAEVLGVERVGREDGFFDLGGHSLLAVRVMSRVREAFAVELPLRELFESPTVAGLARAVDDALRRGSAPAPPLVRVPRDGELPLSFAQQRLWFLHQLDPLSPAYHVPGAFRLEGRVAPGLLRRVFSEIARRHESLRTSFPTMADRPVQVVASHPDLPLPVIDLSGLPAAQREPAARRLAAEWDRRPFDLAAGPLIRAALVRLAEEDHLALLTLHHIVADGWSLGVLFKELAALYGAWSRGEASPLRDLPLQYADFACWQRRWLTGEVLNAEVAWWRGRLAGAPPSLDLATDRPRPPVQTFRGRALPVSLPLELSTAVVSLARRERATPFMVLLAGFQALLGRYSGQEDVVVGSPIAGRNRRELEGVIGFFVNTLALRGDLEGDPRFVDHLRRVRGTALEAYLHQDLPFEQLVEALNPERGLSRNPVFQVAFALQNIPRMDFHLPGLRLSRMEREARTAKFDLSLTLQEGAGGLSGSLEYSTDLFDAGTVERLAGHLGMLLGGGIVDDPEMRIGDLPLLAPEERQQILLEWSGAAVPRTVPDGGLHDLFEARVQEDPGAVAVIFGASSLTYGELDARAEALAGRLRALGVGPETLVGICAGEGIERVVGVLGVFKAGGAYLPLDPAYPKDRLAFMVEDAGIAVLLVQERLRGLLPDAGARALCFEQLADAAPAGPAPRKDDGRRALGGEALAYVIYTSGSTGRPNGVLIRHGSAVKFILQAIDHFRVERGSRVLQAISFSFDGSILETWMALASGGTLCVADREARISGEVLAERIRDHGITTAVLPPAVLAALSPEGVPGLRALCIGADRCPAELASRWAPPASSVTRMRNCYGPTETTVYVTTHSCSGTYRKEPPIGRPIAGARAYVLDPRGGLVPAGVPGELCIAGEGLARGYLRRPGRTAERFVPNPFSPEPGGRLYRTGDRVRWLPDGALEFLGRVDFQVKIRGLRIELGEIEAVLGRHPGVGECAAGVHPGPGGDPLLVVYVVPRETGGEASAAELRQHLRERLPDYMVPPHVVFLESLPLTSNGKLNRKALPAPDGKAGEEQAPARDELELAIGRIWEELLGRPVGVRDDFFDLGGHSLLAVQLLSRIRDRLGHRIALADMFRGATVERMAGLLRDEGTRPQRSAMVELQAGNGAAPLFLVHPVGGNVLCYLEFARHLGGLVYGLQTVAVGESLEEMAARYVASVREVQPAGPYRLAGWSLGGAVAYEMARQLQGSGERVDLLALIDPSVPALSGDELGPEPDDAALAKLFARDVEGLRGLPPELGDEESRELLEVFRSNVRSLRAWRPRPYPGRAVLFRAAEPLSGEPADPVERWGGLVEGGLEVEDAEGHHYSILVGPRARRLAERLRGRLGREAP